MHRKADQRNFGYGKQIGFAITNALQDRYGDKGIKTRCDHRARLRFFERFVKDLGVRDLRDVDQRVIDGYIAQLKTFVGKEAIALKTAVNRLSSMNVLLTQVRRDKLLFVSPSKSLGRLKSVRTVAPIGMENEQVEMAADKLTAQGHADVAVALRLCRYFGLRIREAALLNIPNAIRQVKKRGSFNVTRGTKGGRGQHVDRWISVSEIHLQWLQEAVMLCSSTNCLVPDHLTYYQWYQRSYFQFRRVAAHSGLTSKFHELRACYASERYADLTGHQAPLSSICDAPRFLDLEARIAIAKELGHGRAQITNAYLGGRH